MEVRRVFYPEPIHMKFGSRRSTSHEIHPNMVVLETNSNAEERSIAVKAGMTALLQPQQTSLLETGQSRILYERTPQSDGLSIIVSENETTFYTLPALDSGRYEGKKLMLEHDYTIALGERVYVNEQRVNAVTQVLLIRRSGLHSKTPQPVITGGIRS